MPISLPSLACAACPRSVAPHLWGSEVEYAPVLNDGRQVGFARQLEQTPFTVTDRATLGGYPVERPLDMLRRLLHPERDTPPWTCLPFSCGMWMTCGTSPGAHPLAADLVGKRLASAGEHRRSVGRAAAMPARTRTRRPHHPRALGELTSDAFAGRGAALDVVRCHAGGRRYGRCGISDSPARTSGTKCVGAANGFHGSGIDKQMRGGRLQLPLRHRPHSGDRIGEIVVATSRRAPDRGERPPSRRGRGTRHGTGTAVGSAFRFPISASGASASHMGW